MSWGANKKNCISHNFLVAEHTKGAITMNIFYIFMVLIASIIIIFKVRSGELTLKVVAIKFITILFMLGLLTYIMIQFA